MSYYQTMYGTDDLNTQFTDMDSQEPVRHGKWIKTEELQNCHDINGHETWGIKYMCESCGFQTFAIEGHFAQYKYCPNCGCRMDEE